MLLGRPKHQQFGPIHPPDSFGDQNAIHGNADRALNMTKVKHRIRRRAKRDSITNCWFTSNSTQSNIRGIWILKRHLQALFARKRSAILSSANIILNEYRSLKFKYSMKIIIGRIDSIKLYLANVELNLTTNTGNGKYRLSNFALRKEQLIYQIVFIKAGYLMSSILRSLKPLQIRYWLGF